jgi:PAS domain S-box-containing protein
VKRGDLAVRNYTDRDFISDEAEIERKKKEERQVIETGEPLEAKHMIPKTTTTVCNTDKNARSSEEAKEDMTKDQWFTSVQFPLKNAQGEIVGLGGFCQDITESHQQESMQIEEALRQSEERHRTLFEKMMQGVVYQDASGNIISANPSAERILGLTMDQMMGRSSVDPRWKSVKEDGSDYPGEMHPAMVALKTGQSVINAIMGVYHPADDSQHWISIDAVPLFKPNETKPFQVYSTFTDITEQKRSEQEILRAKEKAQVADKLKSAFLANMSHEIRTPLNGILGHIDIALSNELSEECREENLEGLEVARESGYLLVSIINDILDLSKIEAKQMAIGMQPFSLRNLVNQSIKVGNVLLKSRKRDAITLTHHVEDKISKCVYGDNFRIQQVINNLISNAVKFTERGSVRLSVELSEDGEMLNFSVQDTGRGISEDQLEVIFEAFRQVDFSDTRKFSGTGLGLTISRKLVDMMGGTLVVKSIVDEGSTFQFTLPYKEAPNESIEEVEQIAKKVAQVTSITGGRILIAEDDAVSRKVATKMVENAGYDVVLAENGRIAVSKFESDENIDLILMDVNMEIMGGLEATSLIRSIEAKHQNERRIPIIGLSAAAMSGDRERGAASGMTDYLTKPVNREALIATLEQYLGKKVENGGKGSNSNSNLKKRRI